MALDDRHFVPARPERAWDVLIDEFIAILVEKQAHMRAGLPALGADREVSIRRLIWKTKVAKVMKAEATR